MTNYRNVIWHHATVTCDRGEQLHGHNEVLLFSGLSGTWKATLAPGVKEAVRDQASPTFVCDGDNVRHGLCADLGFAAEDRPENIRRAGEMAKLFLEAWGLC